MNFVTKLTNKFVVRSAAFKNAVQHQSFRMYKAAMDNRLVSDFLATATTINRDIRSSISKVRARARNLWKNNDYVKGYSIRIRTNIVGYDGFSFQNRAVDKAGKELSVYNRLIEDKFEEWGKRQYCTMAGVLSLTRLMWVEVQHLKRDGEFFVRMITGKNAGNKFGFSLDPIEPEMCDENYNTVLPNGNVVLMGVERNEWTRPVAFYFKQKNAQFELAGSYPSYNLVRVPAEEIIHVFDPEHYSQARGMSALAAGMISLHQLDGWENAAVVNARVGATKQAFMYYDPGVMAPENFTGDEVDSSGDPIQNLTPGSFDVLPKGWKVQEWNPAYPHQQHQSFVKSMLRKWASGIGAAYNSIANDLEGVNFSSMRSGLQEERDSWMMDQKIIIDGFLVPLFEQWIRYAVLFGALDVPYSQLEMLCKPFFMGRRWPWVDPEKDVDAEIKAISFGLNSRKRALQKQGYDWREILDENKAELDYAKELGIEFSKGNTSAITNKITEDGEDNTDGEKGRGKVDAKGLRIAS